MSKIENDKYFTPPELAKELVELTWNTIGTDWDRIIEPSAGTGNFLQFLPKYTLAYDIEPMAPNIIQADYRKVVLPYIEKSLVIGNPPFGNRNNLSRQFIKASLQHSPYIAFIQPISQLNNNIQMSNTELLYSKDLGENIFTDRKLHTCFNIYHYKLNGHKQNYDIPGISIYSLRRTGKEEYKNNDNLIYDYRICEWGSNIHVLEDNEIYASEIIIKAENEEIRKWLSEVINYDWRQLVNSISTPRLPIWRVKQFLYKKYYNLE